MKLTLGILGIGLLGSLLLLFAFWKEPLACGVRFEITEDSSKDGLNVRSGSISTKQYGLLVSNEVDMSLKSFSITLRGQQDFQFHFSENIKSVRLMLGSEEIYNGKPIDSFDATNKPRAASLTIKPERTGNAFSMEITDQCSVGTFLDSLLR